MAITLRAARVNSNLSQAKAAEMLGVSKATLANYENGKTTPNTKVITLIEKSYGLSYDNIIFMPKKYD